MSASVPRPPKRPFHSPLECPICFEAYDLNSHVPHMGTCGHTMCADCRSDLPRNCPVCQQANAFANEVKNFLVIELLEEKLNEKKRKQEMDSECSVCHKAVNDSDCRTCLTCILNTQCDTFDELMKDIDSKKMCSNCSEAMNTHGHSTYNLCDAKHNLFSVDLQLNMKFFAEQALPRLDEFRTACKILRDTYKKYYETYKPTGRMSGSASEFTALRASIFENVVGLHRTLLSNTCNIWKLTYDCLEATESLAQEKKKLQCRKFRRPEFSAFNSILTSTRKEELFYDADKKKQKISVDDWNLMTPDEKKAKAQEMIQEVLDSGDVEDVDENWDDAENHRDGIEETQE